MNITIRDIAARAGVSFKTVSRVLNNESSVKDATKEKVMAIVEELGYQPNNAARNLAGNHTYSVGYIYNNPNAYYVIEFQEGLLKSCHNAGFELLIHPVKETDEALADVVDKLVKRSRIAGLVLTPPFSEDPATIEMLTTRKIPFVRVISGQAPITNEPNSVYVDDFKAAKEIGDYIVSLGHTDIAILSGDEEHASTQQRVSGFKSALECQHHVKVLNGEYSFESGVANMRALIEEGRVPSAVFALNDEIAAGALFAARLYGLQIPEQLSITGFEDSPFSRQTWPRLTTAHQPNHDIARSAGERLVKLICNSDLSDTPTLSFQPKLVKRDSTSEVAELSLA
ncbi:LacI family DNA-binding transcriptional regulator [uncultured Umboniibacter sp.]|uniref:LacI family DNA-binding transcriptional regulator n=1 Tax=uncultured Umboniibacter sp. TaxID=1798917 RepID=UPI00262C7B1E|nr:LacI family DNA-binding transcriptional regulator [uncultured Umboniibacter sp.]